MATRQKIRELIDEVSDDTEPNPTAAPNQQAINLAGDRTEIFNAGVIDGIHAAKTDYANGFELGLQLGIAAVRKEIVTNISTELQSIREQKIQVLDITAMLDNFPTSSNLFLSESNQ